jgi:hypothetical protein
MASISASNAPPPYSQRNESQVRETQHGPFFKIASREQCRSKATDAGYQVDCGFHIHSASCRKLEYAGNANRPQRNTQRELIMTDIKEILALVSQSPRADAPMAKAALERIVELEKARARYEHVRRLRPFEFDRLFARSLMIGNTFDGLVDAAIAAQSKEQG